MKQHSLLLAACLLSVPIVAAEDGPDSATVDSEPVEDALPIAADHCRPAGYTQNSEDAPPVKPYVNKECITD